MNLRTLIAVVIGLATLGLATGYAVTERWTWVAGISIIALLWLAEPWHGAHWVAALALVLFTGAAVVGVFLGLPTFWLFSSLVAVLVAWDLDRFANHLDDVPDVRDETALTASHIRRLGIATGLGWILGLFALNVRFTFDFVVTLALALLVIVALSRAVRQVQGEDETSQS
jgi:hypothetical protein